MRRNKRTRASTDLFALGNPLLDYITSELVVLDTLLLRDGPFGAVVDDADAGPKESVLVHLAVVVLAEIGHVCGATGLPGQGGGCAGGVAARASDILRHLETTCAVPGGVLAVVWGKSATKRTQKDAHVHQEAREAILYDVDGGKQSGGELEVGRR